MLLILQILHQNAQTGIEICTPCTNKHAKKKSMTISTEYNRELLKTIRDYVLTMYFYEKSSKAVLCC